MTNSKIQLPITELDGLDITRTPFIVPYRVQADQIEILAIIHGARHWPDKL